LRSIPQVRRQKEILFPIVLNSIITHNIVYNDERNATKLREFVERKFKSPLLRIVTGSKYSRQDRTFEEFLAEETSKRHCIFMGKNGDSPNLEIMSIASLFAKDFLVGFSGEASQVIRGQFATKNIPERAFICIGMKNGNKLIEASSKKSFCNCRKHEFR
jgi:hypothetical protein